jgi:nicotinamide riboside transporter PnuC
MIFSLGGNVLIMKKKRVGWLAWIVGNILWILINFLDVLNIPMVCMYVAYLIINISGYIEWRRK